MTDWTSRLLKRPDLPEVVERLNALLADERSRRQAFREWITPGVKAEFINGEVVLHSPVRRRHWKVVDLLSSLLSVYVRTKDLGVVGTEKILVTLTRNDYEPDIVFYSKEKADAFTDDQLLFPAPDFIVEVLSRKTAAIDQGVKKQDYAAHGVQEYWIVDPQQEWVEQYYLALPTDKEYLPARVYGRGDVIESHVVSGFTIPVIAIFNDAVNLEVLRQLTAQNEPKA
ncbi:MAG: Uma2 family endonuclease [Saprospiraceae bacterium]|nr:Uma2 family endonuclease [Saprospiraceae bacterium]MDW8230624.1 Uma2 family endonuclease [Saprospiraceae bacterium]